MDSLQSICSIDDIRIVKPQPGDVGRFIDTIDAVAGLAEQEFARADAIAGISDNGHC
jgi:hypothetical protein